MRFSPSTLGLVVPIASITAVGVGIALAIPLLSITLAERGISAGWIGINAATWGLASMAMTPFVPRLAARFGTGRMLAIAILVGAATLPLFYLFEDFWVWFPLRAVSGAALAVAFILSEFWITSSAAAGQRGLIMGIYATVLSIGLALGPAVLAIAGTEGLLPFLIGAAIMALAAVPVILAPVNSPAIGEEARGGFLRFLVIAPAATGAAVAFGFAEGGSFALLPIYGQHVGHAVSDVVLFAAAVTLGNVLLQIPIGLVSDRVDRRRLLLVIAVIGLAGAALLPTVAASLPWAMVLLFVWGGFIGGLYTVGLAHLGQRFSGADLAAANSAFVFCYSAGSLFGPAGLGIGMEAWDPHGFAVVLAACFLAYVILLVARMVAVAR
ncbi:MAG: MFS transporter [Bauldia sp.]